MLEAIATFSAENGNIFNGRIKFKEYSKYVKVTINLQALFDIDISHGHGIHVHNGPEDKLVKCSSSSCCSKLGGHFNPLNTVHGSYQLNTIRHIGDLCNNIYFDKNGHCKYSYNDYLISLRPDNIGYIVGLSIVIHDGQDDCGLTDNKDSLTTGNAGSRLDCTTIYSHNHWSLKTNNLKR